MSNKRRLYLVLMQVVLWAAFIALPYFMVPRQTEITYMEAAAKQAVPPTDMAEHIFLGSLAFNICLIAFFYLHHYILFDKLIVTRRRVVYSAIILAAFIFCFTVSYIFKECVLPQQPVPYHHSLAFRDVVRTATWFLLVLLSSLGIKLLNQWRQAEQRTKEIETEQLRTELSFLHAQINPHFLFNSLNTIYSLSLKKSNDAPLAILKLSDLLRYVIDESKNEKVPLEQEINYIHNYIELQKLRSTSSLVVNFKQEGGTGSASIAPLLLLPFVENAFKYGISNSEPSPIDIVLRTTATELEFSVANKKMEGGIKPSTGIGINNVKRRLKLLYPDKHELTINDNPGNYFIKLKISLV